MNVRIIADNEVRFDLWWIDEKTARIAEKAFLRTGRQQRLYGNNVDDWVYVLDARGILGIGTWNLE